MVIFHVSGTATKGDKNVGISISPVSNYIWLNRITHHFYVLCDVSSKISQTRSGTVWSSVEQHGRPEFKYCQEHLLFRSARNFTHIAYYSLVPGRVHKKNLQKDIINNISSNTS